MRPLIPRSRVAVGLVHWPVLDKRGDIVATNVTNLDVHDIGRAARVYGVEKYYVINPMKEQLSFVARILDFWKVGGGVGYNSMRRTALLNLEPVETIEKAAAAFGAKIIIGTSAREIPDKPTVGFRALRERIWDTEDSVLILFGTGFGMETRAFESCEAVLEPIRGIPPDDYRHLSVRSAVSICLDRLMGAW